MPGRVCRSVALAVSSCTQADWADSAPPLGSGGDCPSAATRMCSPSTTGRARLIASRSASSRAPPAAVMASMTREEAGRVRTPGVATAPETWTTTSPALSIPGVAGAGGGRARPPPPPPARRRPVEFGRLFGGLVCFECPIGGPRVPPHPDSGEQHQDDQDSGDRRRPRQQAHGRWFWGLVVVVDGAVVHGFGQGRHPAVSDPTWRVHPLTLRPALSPCLGGEACLWIGATRRRHLWTAATRHIPLWMGPQP